MDTGVVSRLNGAAARIPEKRSPSMVDRARPPLQGDPAYAIAAFPAARALTTSMTTLMTTLMTTKMTMISAKPVHNAIAKDKIIGAVF